MKDEKIDILLKNVKQGNNESFEKLLEIYFPLIESMAVKYSAGTQGADADLLKQDARLALYRAAVSFVTEKDKISFGLYAKICMRNAIISELRKISGANRRMKKAAERSAAQGVAFGFDAEREQIYAAVEKNEAGLSLLERTVFEMLLDGKKVREIAAELEENSKSISNAAFRARTKIKAAIRK